MKFIDKKIVYVFLIAIFSYLIFYWPVLRGDTYIYSGKDMDTLHLPSKYFLYESLLNGVYPLWTDRILGGYPIFKNMERGFMHPLNLIFVYIFGPLFALKLLHFGHYMFGSYCLYLFLKKRGFEVWEWAAVNFIYFFSFFGLNQNEHPNLLYSFYLLPAFLYFISEKRNIFFALIFADLFYFGAFQGLLINTLVSGIFLLFLYKDKMQKFRAFFPPMFFSFLVILPGLFFQIQLYSQSYRSQKLAWTEGSYSLGSLLTLVIPAPFGVGSYYKGSLVFDGISQNELYAYCGLLIILSTLLYFKLQKNDPYHKFLLALAFISLFLMLIGSVPFLNQLIPPPFNFFRYWGRAVYIFSFSLANLFVLSLRDYKSPQYKRLFIFPILGLLAISSISKPNLLSAINIIRRSDFIFDVTWVLPIALLMISFLLFIAKRLNYKLVLMFVLLDMIVSTKLVTTKLFANIKNFESSNILSNVPIGKKVFDATNRLNGDNALINPANTLQGYEVLERKADYARSADLGLVSSRYSVLKNDVSEEQLKIKLKKYGVEMYRCATCATFTTEF